MDGENIQPMDTVLIDGAEATVIWIGVSFARVMDEDGETRSVLVSQILKVKSGEVK